MKKMVLVAIGIFFAGMVVEYNLFLNDYNYGIIYFGNGSINGKVVPIIKLVKKLRTTQGPFYFMDPGKEIEVRKILMGAQAIEFNDNEVDEFIKKRYCK